MRTTILAVAGIVATFGSWPAWAADSAQQEANKKAVVAFYEKGLN
jgi:hypothetical protein